MTRESDRIDCHSPWNAEAEHGGTECCTSAARTCLSPRSFSQAVWLPFSQLNNSNQALAHRPQDTFRVRTLQHREQRRPAGRGAAARYLRVCRLIVRRPSSAIATRTSRRVCGRSVTRQVRDRDTADSAGRERSQKAVVFKTTAIRHPSASKSPAFARFPVRRHAEWPGVTGSVTVTAQIS